MAVGRNRKTGAFSSIQEVNPATRTLKLEQKVAELESRILKLEQESKNFASGLTHYPYLLNKDTTISSKYVYCYDSSNSPIFTLTSGELGGQVLLAEKIGGLSTVTVVPIKKDGSPGTINEAASHTLGGTNCDVHLLTQVGDGEWVIVIQTA